MTPETQARKRKTLYERLIDGIRPAWNELRKHPRKNTRGVDAVSIHTFAGKLSKNIASIRTRLRNDSYIFSKLRPVIINPKSPKPRTILVYTVEDRVVSKAILDIIRPRFKSYDSGSDYSIKGKRIKGENFAGVPLASRQIQKGLADGYTWVFETDIKSFFDAVPKNKVLDILQKKLRDPRMFRLINGIVKFQIDEQHAAVDNTHGPDDGIAQGSSLSPLIAGVYLFDFDKAIQNDPEVQLIRYVDDLVILCKSEAKAKEMYGLTKTELAKLELEIHELDVPSGRRVKTKITDAAAGSFTFLGLNFNRGEIDISDGKKKQCLQDIQDILNNKGGLIDKRQKIMAKLDGFISQYNQRHYKAKASLRGLCIQAEKMLRGYHVANTKEIFGWNPFSKLNDTQVTNYSTFLGLNITRKLFKKIG